MKQRIFAILLSLTMIFTLVPTAWAENNGITTEAELRTAIENATGEKNTITLAEDIGLAEKVLCHLQRVPDTEANSAYLSVRKADDGTALQAWQEQKVTKTKGKSR